MAIPFEVTMRTGEPLLLMEPNAVERRSLALAAPSTELAAPGGARIAPATLAPAFERYEYEFRVEDWERRASLKTFFAARKGRMEAFWIPTWQWEFDVTGYSEPWLYVARNGFAESIFAARGQLSRFVLLWGDRYAVRSIIDVEESVSPGVDRLMFNVGNGPYSDPLVPSLVPQARPDDAYRLLWLRYGRFDTDEFRIDHKSTNGAAIITLPFIELPANAPEADT